MPGTVRERFCSRRGFVEAALDLLPRCFQRLVAGIRRNPDRGCGHAGHASERLVDHCPIPGLELRAAAGPEHQDLITELFEKIVLYDVAVTAAQVRRAVSGYDVVLDVAAKQFEANAQGAEIEVPLDTWFQVAVFPASERSLMELQPLYLEHHRVRSGMQRITLRVADKPGTVAVDPFHLHAKPATLDRDILRCAKALQERSGASLTAVHCHEPVEYFGADLQGGEARLEAVRRLCTEAGVSPDAAKVVAGAPHSVLTEMQRRGEADLVVMGALARGRLAELIVGHTAERVLHYGNGDVLAVAPPAARP